MTTTPDPQTVREIAREHVRSGRCDIGITVELMLISVTLDREELAAWETAVEQAIKTAALSWPDGQPQDACPLDPARKTCTNCGHYFLAHRNDVGCTHCECNAGIAIEARAEQPQDEQDERDARIAQLERELRDLRGTELNPSPTVLDAEGYRYLADEIGATMTDEWDGDEAESWILVQYVRWLAAGQPRDEDGYPVRREAYPVADAKAAQSERDGGMRAVASPAALVAEFHAAFDLPRANTPALLDDEQADFRHRILVEEIDEIGQAVARADLVNLAQELADAVYVIYGTALAYGIDLDAVLAEVHRANMAKLGPDERPVVVDGKVVKPDGWRKPDVGGVLAALEARDAKAPVKRTPEQWCAEYDVDIRDPDGWRGKSDPPWDEPITLADFYKRATSSTVRAVPSVDWQRIARDAKEAT